MAGGKSGTQRRRPRWLDNLFGSCLLAYVYVLFRTVSGFTQVMTAIPISVWYNVTLEDVVRLMEKRHVRRVPVVRGAEVVGIISRANLVHALAGIARETKQPAASDQVIRDRIVAELAGQSWSSRVLVNVDVQDPAWWIGGGRSPMGRELSWNRGSGRECTWGPGGWRITLLGSGGMLGCRLFHRPRARPRRWRRIDVRCRTERSATVDLTRWNRSEFVF